MAVVTLTSCRRGDTLYSLNGLIVIASVMVFRQGYTLRRYPPSVLDVWRDVNTCFAWIFVTVAGCEIVVYRNVQ